MRPGLVLLLLLVASVAPAVAATPLAEEDLDQVSAAGFSLSLPFIAPVVITVPTTFVNIPINVNTVIDTNIGVNTAVGVCGYCAGTPGPTVLNSNPLANPLTVNIPQSNTFTPTFNFTPVTTIGVPSLKVTPPTLTVPTITIP